MEKKASLGNDPFGFIKNSKEEEQEKEMSGEDSPKGLEAESAVLHELIEAMYLELGRVSHGVSNLSGTSIPSVAEKIESHLEEKLGQGFTTLNNLLEAKGKEQQEQLKEQLSGRERELEELKSLHRSEVEGYQTRLSEATSRQEQLKEQLSGRERELAELKEEQNHLARLLQFRDREIIEQRETVAKLNLWLKELDTGVRVLLDSKRWKMGNSLGEMQRKVFMRPQVPMPEQHIIKVLKKYKAWKE